MADAPTMLYIIHPYHSFNLQKVCRKFISIHSLTLITSSYVYSKYRHTLYGMEQGEMYATEWGYILTEIQTSLAPQSTDMTDMMIHDRQRSFQVHWRRNSDINLFYSAKEVMGSKMKMHRWVRQMNSKTVWIEARRRIPCGKL
jgi:hypothetical protein